jgi:hypothetical protein
MLSRERSSILQDSVKSILHTKSTLKEIVFVTSVLLWFTKESSFEKYHSGKHFYTLSKHFVSTGLRSLILELQNVTKRACKART